MEPADILDITSKTHLKNYLINNSAFVVIQDKLCIEPKHLNTKI